MQTAKAQRAALLVDCGCIQTLNPTEHGGSVDQGTTGSSFCPSEVVWRIFGDCLAARSTVDVRAVRLRRVAHDLSSAANCWYVGRGALVQLSSGAFETTLVELELGSDSGSTCGRPFFAGRHHSHLWRRHGHAASGEESLWQETASRCRTIDAFLHCVALGSQMGRAGNPGTVAGAEPTVGLASLGGILSFPRRGQETGTSSQDTLRPDATTLLCAATVVSSAEIPLFRRWRFRHTSPRKVRRAPVLTGVGQQVLQGCQPLQPTAQAKTWHEWKTPRQRAQTTFARGSRREGTPSAPAGLVVWRWSPTSRRRDRHVALVQVGRGIGSCPLVFVEDLTGTHRDEYFFTTDISLTPKQIIDTYTGRWAIEVMFEETREHVGLESTRGPCAKTILRAEPCLF